MDQLISVIVPVYKVEPYLERCVQSIMHQTYRHLEIILVDDGSPDRCGEMCDSFAEQDSRIRVVHKENGGLSDARNYGISISSGAYITCIDSDDYVDPDYVEYLYNLIQKYRTKMSICQHRVTFMNGAVKDFGSYGEEEISSKQCLEKLLYHDVIDASAWAKLYHKDLFQAVNYPIGRLYEDIATTPLLMMLCDRIAVGYLSKYNYIIRDNSIVTDHFRPAKLDLIDMTDNMADSVIKMYPDLEEATLRRRVYARFSTLNQMLHTKQCEPEKKHMIFFIKEHRKAIMRNPHAPKRDKIAILLLSLHYGIYRYCWIKYCAVFKGDRRA